jgi:pimeloyl-ACP methyl ester carboxylesterase
LGIGAPASAQALKPCRIEGIKTEVQCGVVSRALDPAQPVGTQIEVHYVVVPALARRKRPDPVFFLAGGPGQSAIQVAPVVLQLLARLNNRRDLVFVDQRGTGRSAPLKCEDRRHRPLTEQLDVALRDVLIAQCLAQLEKLPYGDLRHFTTMVAMQDLDAVRQALGASAINLVGGSYGSRAALEYMRQFPHAVRRSVLDGVAPPDMILPVSFSTDGQAALDALLDACDKEAVCHSAHPGLRADWARLLAALPKLMLVTHPMTGQPEELKITREIVLSLVRSSLYSPVAASALPFAIGEAARGRLSALVGLSVGAETRRAGELAMGMHFSVVCAEDVPRMKRATDVPGMDFGVEFGRFYERICADWPRAEVPAAFFTVPPAPALTLLLSGALDPVTPPRHAERVAKALGPKAQHLVAPNAGHGLMTLGCMRDVLVRFIDAVDDVAAAEIDTSCGRRIPRPPAFVPVSAADQGSASDKPKSAP